MKSFFFSNHDVRSALTCAVIAAALGGCGSSSRTRDIVKAGAIGAGGGAIIGAVVPGISTLEGAAVGAVGGTLYGIIKDKDNKERNVYKDEKGNRFWVDDKGKRRYL